MIQVKNLAKSFGPKRAVDGVSFNVEIGEVLGFLGPNGAGKSTTMRMITGFIPPTEGTVVVGGFDILNNPIQVKKIIGYLPENAPAYADMSVHSFLDFVAELRGLRGEERKKAVSRVIEMCFLESVVNQSIDTLSKGFRHRTCFAQSIIHDPPVLVLDEPTDGLDPNQKHEVRTLIKRMGEKKAILFSTHILEEVESACTRAIIIDRGKIVANGTPNELKRMSELAGTVILKVRNIPAEEVVQKVKELSCVKRASIISTDGGPACLRVYPQQNITNGELARAVGELAIQQQWRVEELHTDEGRLDEVFRNITLPDTTQEVSR